jgi:hypothetical protein
MDNDSALSFRQSLEKREWTRQFIQKLKDYSDRNRVTDKFDETDFVSTFELLSKYVTSVGISFKRFSMLRSRATQHGMDFENIKQMGYPPDHRVKKFGRCNFPDQSMLYSANNIETSFLEIELNDTTPSAITIQFNLKENEEIRLLSIGELDHYRRHGRTRVDTPGVSEQLDKILEPLDQYERIAYQFVDAYFADYFSRVFNEQTERNLYEVTARIAHALLMQPDIDGIIYPSVQHAGGLNFAIKPDIFDAKFTPGRYILTTPIFHYGHGLFEFHEHSGGTHLSENGNFIWQTVYKYALGRSTWPLSAES